MKDGDKKSRFSDGDSRVQVTKLLLQDKTTSLCILLRKVKIVVL